MLDVTLGMLYSKANKDKTARLQCARRTGTTCSTLMKTYNDLQTDKPATAFYTNDFLP